ncbi:MAG: hypothetical protein AAFY22_06655 [Pseudomonadota bacterium]
MNNPVATPFNAPPKNDVPILSAAQNISKTPMKTGPAAKPKFNARSNAGAA